MSGGEIPGLPPLCIKRCIYRNQLNVGKPLIVATLIKNTSFRSYSTFAYLLPAHIRNINMRQLVHVDMN